VTSEHERINTAGAAAGRAWRALAALEMARTSEDVDRARHGAQHELETILRVLGFTVPELPRGATTRGRRADKVIVDDELPFEDWPDSLKTVDGLARVVRPPDYGEEIRPLS